MSYSNKDLPKMLTRTLDNLPYPFFIREKESARYIYANIHVAKLSGLKSVDAIIDRIEGEIPARIYDNEAAANLWQNQVREVANTQKSLSLLEVYPKELDYPYMTKKSALL